MRMTNDNNVNFALSRRICESNAILTARCVCFGIIKDMTFQFWWREMLFRQSLYSQFVAAAQLSERESYIYRIQNFISDRREREEDNTRRTFHSKSRAVLNIRSYNARDWGSCMSLSATNRSRDFVLYTQRLKPRRLIVTTTTRERERREG